MTPVRISIENWGPFKAREVFEFPQGPGLYFLWGRNEVDPRLGSNGAGKSRVWEALCWVFFGKISRGLKAGDVANWDQGKGATVTFEYLVDGELPCSITRTWSPNSWTWTDWAGVKHDLAKDETNQSYRHLGLSFTSFLSTILLPQRSDMFLDLKADKKAELFSEVMGLDRWLEHSQKAGKKAQEADLRCRALEKELARLEGQRDQIDDRPTEKLSQDWVRAREARLDELEAIHGRTMSDRKARVLKKAECLVEEAEARARLKAKLDALGNEEDQLAGLRELTTVAGKSLTARETELKALTGHVAFLKDHDHCPTCDQDLDPKVKGAQITKAARVADDLEHEVVRARKAYKQAIDNQLESEKLLSSLGVEVNRARGAVDDAAAATRRMARDIDVLDQDLDRIEDEAERLEAASNPYSGMLADSADRGAKLAKEIKQTRRLLDDADEQYRLLTSWQKWFKEIRLEQIGEALTQLEIEVNSEVSGLGLIGWELKFEVDRETKGGSIQRGFAVTVASPHNVRAVPWESWSGGEAQRLRVAAQWGLANLIRTHTGADLNLEVWDEPTDGMSPEGISDLLNSLEARATTEARQIWIVDHRALSHGGFAGSAGVVKTKTGSHFELDGLYISAKEKPRARQRLNEDPDGGPPHDVVGLRTRTRRTTERTKA